MVSFGVKGGRLSRVAVGWAEALDVVSQAYLSIGVGYSLEAGSSLLEHALTRTIDRETVTIEWI